MSEPVKKGNCREVHLFVVNGTRIRTDLQTATRFMSGKAVIGSALGLAILQALTKNVKFDAEIALHFRLLYWVMSVGITVFMWWALIVLLSHTWWKKWPDRAFPSIIISMTTVFCIVWIAVGSLILTGVVPDYSVVQVWDFIRSGILALVFEFLLVALVWPIYLNNRKSEETDTPPSQIHDRVRPPELKPTENYIVQIGDLSVDTRMLLTIQAQEHYVELSCINRKNITRLSISKAVAALEGRDGMQIHRSWWVSRKAAKQLKREDGKLVLELNTGETIPVSRGRSADVRAWMKTIPHDAEAEVLAKKDPV